MSGPAAVAALLLAGAIGAAGVAALWPPGEARPRALVLALGAALGPALLSCVAFLARAVGAPPAALLAADAVLAAAALGLAWRLRAASPPTAGTRPEALRGLGWAALCVLGLATLAALVALAADARARPHGLWDAWAIWNLKARILAAGPPGWTDALAVGTPHPDYPLLHPTAVARLWWYGGDATGAPVVLAGWVLATTVAVLSATVAHLRGAWLGAAAGLTLLGCSAFVDLASWQYADPTVSLYMAVSMALALVALRAPPGPGTSSGLLALLGAALGAAAWSKNEGLAWAVLLGGAVLAGTVRRAGLAAGARATLALLAGAAPFAVCVLAVRLGVSARTDLIAGRGLAELAALLGDGERHGLLLRAGATLLVETLGAWRLAALGLLLVLVGEWRSAACRAAALPTGAALLATLALFYGVYLLTPHELAWHLETSAVRVLLQPWPAALVWAFALLAPAGRAPRTT